MTLLRPWPTCRIAVTLGGGITITYGCLVESTRAVKTPRSSQRWYSGRSTACGSYWGGSSKRGCSIPYNRQIIDRLVEVGGGCGGWWRLVVEFAPMADETLELPTTRLARWIAIAAVDVFPVALHLRDRGPRPPLTRPPRPPAAPTPPPPPTS